MDTVQPALPEHVNNLADGETFAFACHPDVPCFTECCRELELALTPYDVLRLKNGLKLRSNVFLERYVIIEKEPGEVFPRLYLAMVNDGRASCPFVGAAGCRVYDNRPGACRAYPLGRAAYQDLAGRHEFHVLLREPHCQGFAAAARHSAVQWTAAQELADYNYHNDEVMTLLQHRQVKKWLRLSEQQTEKFILALYNLDDFRDLIGGPDRARVAGLAGQEPPPAADDVALLRFGLRWLKNDFFGE